MSNKDVAILILAAGKGTRLKSSLAKVLHAAGGRALVEHVVRSCEPLGSKKIILVIGHQAEQVAEVVAPYEVETVVQQPQNGTGHALLVSKRAIGNAKYVVVLPGDAPLVRTETLRGLIHKHKKGEAAATILTAVLADPSGYGRILRKSGDTVAAIIEESQLTAEQRELNEINSSIYCFTVAKLWPALARVRPNNKHHEIYLTDAIAVLNANGDTVLAEIAPDAREALGCNTRADLAGVDRTFREWKRDELMNDGVTIQLPETVLIDPDVKAGEDCVIEPCVQLLGATKIGARCTIKTGSVLHDAVLGDDVTIEAHCLVSKSKIEAEVTAGPFARIRPESHVKKGARIGNFVELKKSVVGEGSKVPHLSYVGDTRIGTKSNISERERLLVISMDFRSTQLRWKPRFYRERFDFSCAGEDWGWGVCGGWFSDYENVPADALGIARGKQVNKTGWASKKRRELAAGEKPKKGKKKRRR